MQFIRQTALALGLLASFTAQAQAANVTTTISKNFAVDGMRWDNGGTLVVLWAVTEVDGMAAICGSFSTMGSAIVQKLSLAAMREAEIKLNGQTLKRNLSYFKRLPNEGLETGHIGAPANCRVSKQAYDAKAELTIGFRSGSYRVSR